MTVNFRCLHTLRGHKDIPGFVAIHQEGPYLITNSSDKLILWNLYSGEQIRTLAQGGPPVIISFMVKSSNAPILVCDVGNGLIKGWNLDTREQILTFRGHAFQIVGLAITPDGKTLASGSCDHTIKVWNLPKHREMGLVVDPEVNSRSIAISPDGQTLAHGSITELKIWEWKTISEIYKIDGPLWIHAPVVFSPDGKTVTSATTDHTIKTWELATGQVIRMLNGHTDDVRSLAFDSNGQILVSGSSDTTVKVWDMTTNQLIQTLTGHTKIVADVAISPNGQTIASTSWDGTIKVWGTDP